MDDGSRLLGLNGGFVESGWFSLKMCCRDRSLLKDSYWTPFLEEPDDLQAIP